jgi:hypothetical protein
MALQIQDGGLAPSSVGGLGKATWRLCSVSLAVNATPVRHDTAKIFTSTYDNFIQTVDIRDDSARCAEIG